MIIVVIVSILSLTALIYTYAVYPLAIALIASRKRSRRNTKRGYLETAFRSEADLPSVTVVLSVYNEERHLTRCLDSLSKIDYPPDKLSFLIGSDGSTDKTNAILSECSIHDPRFRSFLFESRRGKLRVLNDLVPRADTDILFFVDADMTLAHDVLLQHTKHYADADVGGVAGLYQITSDQSSSSSSTEKDYHRMEMWLRKNESDIHSTVGLSGANYSIRRELWKPLPHDRVHDDLYSVFTLLSVGKRLLFESKAVSSEEYVRTIGEEFGRKMRFASRGFETLRQFHRLLRPTGGFVSVMIWSHKIFRWLTPFFIIALIVSIAAGALLSDSLVYEYAAFTISGVFFLIGIGWIGQRNNVNIPIARNALWFAVMNVAFLVGTLRYLFGKEQPKWEITTRAEVRRGSYSMSRKKEVILLVISDFIAIYGSWSLLYFLRFHTPYFHTHSDPGFLFSSSVAIYVFWLLAFMFFGLYRSWYVRPIFDEIVTILKTLATGTLVFILFILWGPAAGAEEAPMRNDPRIIGLLYFTLMAVLTISLRLIVRFSQHRLLEVGIGRRISIILGETDKAVKLAKEVSVYPRLGYEVIGYVSSGNNEVTTTDSSLQYLGAVDELESIIDKHGVREVLIALNSGEHETLLDVIGRTAGSNVGLKIVPDLYDIVTGQARTRQIYGFPLIDVNPELLRPWEEVTKRIIDVSVSALILVVWSPVWLLTALMVKATSKGPVIYSQERIGKNGNIFNIHKFRSMRINAELTGPVWAAKNDPRVTPIGKFLRKSHLDEVPQFWNVLKGDMSLVGPRPERQFFVEKLVKEIPYYTRRLKVRPGITGLYQAMVDKYDESVDDVKERVRYDLMYIESMSFRLDIKILLRTAYMMIRGRGQA